MDIEISVWRVVLVLGLSASAIACGGDPAEGSWESDKKFDGHRHEFSVEEDGDRLVGDGTFYLYATDGSYVRCEGDIEAELKREGKYAVTVRFTGANGCSDVPDVDLDCELLRDDEELDCGTDGGIFNRMP
jgi:hypothetical protein